MPDVDVALAVLVFTPALALGSFLNVVAARLPEKRSLVGPRSACIACKAEIAWHDNIPLVSYFVLRGRCRACGARIGWRYPAVELATALLVAACFLRFGFSGRAFVAAYLCAALVVLSAIDAERRILPDLIVLPSWGVVLAANIALHPERALEYVVASLGASLFLFLRHGLGARKMAIPFGPFLAFGAIVALFAGEPVLDAYLGLF